MKTLILGLLLLGCNSYDSAESDLSNLKENVKNVAQGCEWRVSDAGFQPRKTNSCYHIYAQKGRKLASFELTNVCDAPKLDTCLALHASETPIGYYDWSETDKFEILRYEATETLADGSCPPCE